jgi:nicotinamide riboside transporter PnuC
MPTLSYLSCLLTIASTVLVGRRLWQGWLVAAVNSVIIGAIGWQTGQWGFVPANLFCLAIYAYNLKTWRAPQQNEMESAAGSRQSPTA